MDKDHRTAAAPRRRERTEPRWLAVIAVAAAGVSVALPSGLTLGPRWLFPSIVGILLISAVAAHWSGRHKIDQVLGFIVTSVVTVELVGAVMRLVFALPSHRESPTALLLSAASIWSANVLVFALWYWRLDAGGPHLRETRDGHTAGAFLFPQMMMLPEARAAAGMSRWSPNFLDYLFIAFNTSTAFSPTDTAALTRWSKVLMMIQSVVSLTVLALLAARAVNML